MENKQIKLLEEESIKNSINNLFSFPNIEKGIKKNTLKIHGLIYFGSKSKETISEMLKLRFYLMAKFNLDHEDIVFLRGAQEEMFWKLIQLQTAPNPNEIVNWMFEHGVDATINSNYFFWTK